MTRSLQRAAAGGTLRRCLGWAVAAIVQFIATPAWAQGGPPTELRRRVVDDANPERSTLVAEAVSYAHGGE